MNPELTKALDNMSGDPQDVDAESLSVVASALLSLSNAQIHPMTLRGLGAVIARQSSDRNGSRLTTTLRPESILGRLWRRPKTEYGQLDYYESCRRRDYAVLTGSIRKIEAELDYLTSQTETARDTHRADERVIEGPTHLFGYLNSGVMKRLFRRLAS